MQALKDVVGLFQRCSHRLTSILRDRGTQSLSALGKRGVRPLGVTAQDDFGFQIVAIASLIEGFSSRREGFF